MAKIPKNIPQFAKEEVIKKLKEGSDNYKVYMFLAHGNSLTVSQARSSEFNLTQDLTSRISDLIVKFEVPILSKRVVKDGVLKRYKEYWIKGANERLDNSLLLQDKELS